jgi:hypothetical protein
MSYRTVISAVAAAVLVTACVSTDAFAFRGGHVGGIHAGGVYRGGGYRGGYGRRGVGLGLGLGAAAVGAAVVGPRYYGGCGYYSNVRCY